MIFKTLLVLCVLYFFTSYKNFIFAVPNLLSRLDVVFQQLRLPSDKGPQTE